MKKIIFILVMGVMMLIGNANAAGWASPVPSPPGFWVKFEVSFFRPKTDCKSGFGVCTDVTMGIDKTAGSAEQNLCPVRGQLNERNQLVVEVSEEALSNYMMGVTLPYFKGKTSITILDPYTLSPATCKALGSAVPLTIKPGSYPVSFTSGVYTVVFQL
ncbi:MAG: hypothetical protein WCK34_09205 [Bacteroidota bacterium]